MVIGPGLLNQVPTLCLTEAVAGKYDALHDLWARETLLFGSLDPSGASQLSVRVPTSDNHYGRVTYCFGDEDVLDSN